MIVSSERRPQRPPTHPGEIVGTQLEDCRTSVREAAKLIGVSHTTLQNVIKGKSAITADMALRIGALLGNGPALWLNMQQAHDLWHAEKAIGDQVKKIRKLQAP